MIKRVSQRELIALLIAGTLTLAASVAAIYRDAAPGRKYYQKEFRAIVAEEIGEEEAAETPLGIQQIWI